MDARRLIEHRKKNKKLKIKYILQIWISCYLLKRWMEIKLAEVDTTLIRFIIINELVIRGGSSIPRHIHKLIFRTNRDINKILVGLEREGLINRQSDVSDHRRVIINLTDKGCVYVADLASPVDAICETALAGLSENETEILYKILDKLKKHLAGKLR
jgi:DNA-binding MarR family transcriptional regulator